MNKLLVALLAAFSICAHAQVNQGGGAGSIQNPNAGGGAALPHVQQMIGGKGDGNGVSMPEKGINVSGNNGTVAWADDLNAGIYDPRDTRWGSQATPALQAVAIQAMSNQMACDLAMGVVVNAIAKFPQGNFAVDNLIMAPGSSWEGAAQADGGTALHTIYNNHQAALAPTSMTVTCSDGNSHTDSVALTHVSHFTLVGCSLGGCSNASGDTGNYIVSGPNNTGLEMTSNGIVEHVLAEYFGGYGVRVDGQDAKSFHNRVYSNSEWYYYGGYKGVTESAVSAEAHAVVTGSTGSVALSWPAVTSATGYVIYRGTTAGGESVFYTSATNSFTDTGATNASGTVTNVVTNALGAPGTVTATSSTTGGTLAAATYYYKVTATVADIWHGSYEAVGLDGMADWIEAYGLFDAPTVYTYHHLADFLGGGGFSRFSHIWPQLGQVGIAQPIGYGTGESYEDVRIDFARLEGMYITDWNVYVHGGTIDGSCTATNAATINTGQEGARFSGQCDQLWSTGDATNVSGVGFYDNSGFGPTYKTADILTEAGSALVRNVGAASVQFVPVEGLLGGQAYEPSSYLLTNVTQTPTYGTANVTGLKYVNLNDTSPVSYWSFTGTRLDQDFYVAGGNGNVTIQNDNNHITLCSGANTNLGAVRGYLHFHVTGPNTDQGYGSGFVQEVCNTDDGVGAGVGYPAATNNQVAGASITGGVTTLVNTAFSDTGTNTADTEPFYLVGEYQQAVGTATSANNYVSNVTNWLISYWNGSTAVSASWNVYGWVAQGASPPATVLTYYAPANLTSTAVLYAIDPGLAATSSVNYNSPKFKVRGDCWNGSAATLADWNWQEVFGTGANPTSTLQFTYSGCSGASTVELPGLKLDGNPEIASGVSTNSDISGEFTLSSATTAGPYTWQNTYASHPECTLENQFSSTVARWVTYSGTTSFTINFASAVSGTVSYVCIARN